MLARTLILTALATAFAIAPAAAQNTGRAGAVPAAPAAPAPPAPATQAPPPPPPAPPPGAGRVTAPRRTGQPINIRVEATITDQQGTAAAIKKTVSVVVSDGESGSVRTLTSYLTGGIGLVPLNMDAEATLLPNDKLRVSLRLQYDLPSSAMVARQGPGNDERQPAKSSITESLNVVLENGKSIAAAQSADPVSDRQVLVEVKATVLR